MMAETDKRTRVRPEGHRNQNLVLLVHPRGRRGNTKWRFRQKLPAHQHLTGPKDTKVGIEHTMQLPAHQHLTGPKDTKVCSMERIGVQCKLLYFFSARMLHLDILQKMKCHRRVYFDNKCVLEQFAGINYIVI